MNTISHTLNYTGDKDVKEKKESKKDIDSKTLELKYISFWSGVRGSKRIHDSTNVNKLVSSQQSKLDGKNALKSISAYKKDKFVIHPANLYKTWWDILIGIIVFMVVIVTPYEVFFSIHPNSAEILSEIIASVFFFLDIILTFNVAIIKEDEGSDVVIYDRKFIAISYIKSWFVLDIVSSLPWGAMVSSTSSSSDKSAIAAYVFRLFKLLRLLRLFKLTTLITEYTSTIHTINPTILQFIFLILQVCFIIHIIACIWFKLATNVYGEINENSWITAYETKFGYNTDDMNIQTNYDYYVASLYWVFTTMLTVGYGDILPVTNNERMYAVVIMISGGVVFGAVISQISRLLTLGSAREASMKAKIESFKEFLNDKNVDYQLQKRARDAYSYYLSNHAPFSEDADNIIFDLPETLLTPLASHVFEKEVRIISIFNQELKGSSAFIMQILKNSRPCRAKRGDVIYNAGDVCNEMIFVMEGLVRISHHASNGNETILGMFVGFRFYMYTYIMSGLETVQLWTC